MENIQNPEFELLQCIASEYNSDTSLCISDLLKSNLDWEYLLELAKFHGVLALLYLSLKNLNHELIPVNFLETLKSYYYENAQRNLALFGETLNLVKLLDNNGITANPFKGAKAVSCFPCRIRDRSKPPRFVLAQKEGLLPGVSRQ